MILDDAAASVRLGQTKSTWRRAVFLLLIGLCATGSPAAQSNQVQTLDLTLGEYVQLVLERNESLLAQMLNAEADRRKARAAVGIYEPDLALSASRDANKRQNNAEQQRALLGQQVFEERNNLYNGAIEALVPTGAKIRLGYTLSDLRNNLQPFILSSNSPGTTHQYQTFVGASLTQPLLKNAGRAVTTADIRLAALESDISFQEYRRQLMLTVSQAEASYWNLYFAQEQLRFFEESVGVARSILSDSEQKLKAGQSSELEVLEAQSGLALRRTKQNDAMQNFYQAVGKMQTLYGVLPGKTNKTLRASDGPSSAKVAASYAKSFQMAFDLNPDYLILRKKVDQEKVRFGVAKNQLLPELDMKAAYGYNGLGLSPGTSWDAASSQDFPSWSVGVELHLPLGGNIKGRNQYHAVKLTLQEAIVNLNGLQTQIANALETSIRRAQSWQSSIDDYQTVVRFNEDLLKTELARSNVGKVEPRRVLEVEADLFDARQSLAEALVQYQRSLLELQLADGSLLQSRRLDLTRDELQQKTLALLQNRPPSVEPFRPALLDQPAPSAY